ncbi:hypothetical protein OE88DRAFT_1634923, partial [Heliocybe sulcata]
KCMFKFFEESGIFVMACWHGIILLVCNMVKILSHLPLYDLAMVNKAIDVYGDNLCIGYDIGCAFEGTISRSSISDKAADSGLRMAVSFFHSHAHNRGCQL